MDATSDAFGWAFASTDPRFKVRVEDDSFLGRGANGPVYIAEYCGKVCAAKTFFAFLDPGSWGLRGNRPLVEKVAREASDEMHMLAKMFHPCVLPLIGVAHEDLEGVQIPKWIITPRMDGSLYSLLCQHDPRTLLSEIDASRIARDICSGLAYLHSRHVAHRDVKPQNVLVDATGARLSDMGTAKIVEAMGAHTVNVGTVAYTAAEVATPGYDPFRLDVYALGVTLVVLCLSEDPARTATGHPEDEPVWAEQKRRASLAHAGLAPVIAGCWGAPAARSTAETLCALANTAVGRLREGGSDGAVGRSLRDITVQAAAATARVATAEAQALQASAERDAARAQIRVYQWSLINARVQLVRAAAVADAARNAAAKRDAQIAELAAELDATRKSLAAAQAEISAASRAPAPAVWVELRGAAMAVAWDAPPAYTVECAVDASEWKQVWRGAEQSCSIFEPGLAGRTARVRVRAAGGQWSPERAVVVPAGPPPPPPRLAGVGRGAAVLLVAQGQLGNAYECCVEGGELLVSDTAHKSVTALDGADGRVLRRIGEGELPFATGCAIVGAALFVTDYHNHRMAVYSRATLARLRTFGSKGDGQVQYPWGLKAHEGRLYVAEQIHCRVSVFTTDGTFLYSAGTEGSGAGQLDQPHGLAIAGDLIYVVEARNRRVTVFSADDLSFKQRVGVGVGLKNPYGVSVACGLVVVADSGSHRVAVFDASDGRHVTFLKGFGYHPCGVALRDDGMLFVSNLRGELYRVRLE